MIIGNGLFQNKYYEKREVYVVDLSPTSSIHSYIDQWDDASGMYVGDNHVHKIKSLGFKFAAYDTANFVVNVPQGANRIKATIGIDGYKGGRGYIRINGTHTEGDSPLFNTLIKYDSTYGAIDIDLDLSEHTWLVLQFEAYNDSGSSINYAIFGEARFTF